MNKKRDKPKPKTKVQKCLRCSKTVIVPMGFFMCPPCREIAGNDNNTESSISIGKRQ